MPLAELEPRDDVRDRAARLAARYEHQGASDILRASLELFPAKIALVSSFGTESAVLLHLASRIDPSIPVVFVDTGHLFPETRAYRDLLIERFGLTSARPVSPERNELGIEDPDGFLWASNPDACCRVRKVLPLARALDGFDAWISGRKRFQGATRLGLRVFENEGERIKVNPLVSWEASDILAYARTWDLPRHPLLAKNYLSVGCIPCTSPVRPGEDKRAGRWRGKSKTECGIHTSFPDAGAGI